MNPPEYTDWTPSDWKYWPKLLRMYDAVTEELQRERDEITALQDAVDDLATHELETTP